MIQDIPSHFKSQPILRFKGLKLDHPAGNLASSDFSAEANYQFCMLLLALIEYHYDDGDDDGSVDDDDDDDDDDDNDDDDE